MRPRAPGRSRRGFVLPLVMIVGSVVGALAFTLHSGMLTRGMQVRASSDVANARCLARAAVECVKFGIFESILPPPPGVAPTTSAPELYAFLLRARETLARGVPRAAGADDDRAWLESVLGASALEPVDALAQRLPEARVRLFVECKVAPASAAILDPVIKQVDLTVRVEAQVRHGEAASAANLVLHVYSQLPPAAKFTLAARDARVLATAHVTADGGPWPQGDPPVVLIHHPSDGDPLASDPFARPAAAKGLMGHSVASSEIVTAHADRGLVWLGGGPDRAAVHLPLGAGGAPLGEEHALFAPHGGVRVVPVARALSDQPGPMRAFQAPDPLDPNVKQGAFVMGTVVPVAIDQDPALLGPNPDASLAPSSEVSRLKVHGTAGMPSPTAVIGAAFHTVAALSCIAIDRDLTDEDERAQATAVGRPLPVRDAREPFLAYADEADYETDLIAEGSPAEPSYARLQPFGRQGEVVNQNAYVDADGDGSREAQVSSEIGHELIHLDLSLWKYQNLFASYAEYRRAMSRYVSIPVNLSLELAGRPAEEAQELLRQAAFGASPPTGWSDWLVQRFTLESRDPLHQEPAVKAGGTRWVDAGPEALSTLFASGSGERWPGEPAVVVKGQRAFEARFMHGGVVDLGGARVVVAPAEGETAPGLSFDRVIAVKPGSGGVLEVPRLKCAGLVNADGAGFAPLGVHAAELVLSARGPYEAAFAASRVTIEPGVDYALIRGSLLCDTVPSRHGRPLVIAWDPRLDPVGPNAHFAYRVAISRAARVYPPSQNF